MSGWGIADTASKIEKIKAESADYLHGLDSCGKIEWSTYSDAFDFYEDLIEKAYTQGKEDAQPEIKTDGDTISRQAAIDAWKNDFKGYINALNMPKDDYNGIMEYIDEVPSAQPERKTGRWITKLENHTYECSECGNGIITNKDYLKKHKFCFCCGAKMLKEGDA